MIIKTKRLILRPPSKKDIKDIARNISNLNVSKWLLVVPYPYTKKDAIWWVNKTAKDWKEKKKEGYPFGIALKENDKYIGGIDLHKVNKFQGTAEVGYWLGEDYWRKGYGSEALEAIINFAFKKLKLRRLEAGVFEGNPSSGKLLEKFGFKQEGTLRKAKKSKADKKIKDEYLYGLLREEYN